MVKQKTGRNRDQIQVHLPLPEASATAHRRLLPYADIVGREDVDGRLRLWLSSVGRGAGVGSVAWVRPDLVIG